jgi:hypothetical protein
MTYDELAALLHSDENKARTYVADVGLDRRRSRDGHTRAKLNAYLTEIFLDSLLKERLDRQLSRCAEDLKAMHKRMAKTPASAPVLESAEDHGLAHRLAGLRKSAAG